jgi:two-component system chemotaxis response regulator CheB
MAVNGSVFPAVVAVGASAGGVEALTELVEDLPSGLSVPVLVVLHLAPDGTSMLADLLGRRTPLPVATARDGERLAAGHIYVAPPDRHLVVDAGRLGLDRGPRENGHRPAVDTTFRTVARTYGARAVGVILSGTLDDGALGLAQIAEAGGRALVQHPQESRYAGMPRSALLAVPDAEVLPVKAIAARIAEIAAAPEPVDPAGDPAVPARYDVGASEPAPDRLPTRFVCPDCGGVLFAEHHGHDETFVCSVGHAFSIESLQRGQADQVEMALWAAVRSLDDRAVLLRRLAARAHERGQTRSAGRWEAQARDHERRADLIRSIVVRPEPIDEAAER